MMHISRLKFSLLMAFMIMSWGLAFPLIKISLQDLSPINLTIMRFFVVCIILLFLLLIQSTQFSKLSPKDIPWIFILGFFGVMTYHLALNYGEQYISPGAASLIIGTAPLFVVVSAIVFLKEKVTKKRIAGIFLAFAGIIIISLWGQPSLEIEVKYISGAVAVLVAAVSAAFYTIAGKKLLSRYTALSLTTYAMLLGSIGLLPFLNSSLISEVLQISLPSVVSILFLGIFSTVISYMLWYVVLQIKDASEISIYLYFIPVITILIDLLVFREAISYLFLFGAILIILGLRITSVKDVT